MAQHDLSLAGSSAIVTGGSGDIGSAVATLLLEAGATVASVDLPRTTPPDGVEHLPCDLGDPEQLAALAGTLAARRPAPDLLVHCAGITRDRVLWKLSDEDWSSVLRINLDSAFWVLRALVPGMRALGRGSVVLVASINGERGKLGQANYAASKAGLIGLAKTAARDLGRFGVRVNAVSPGYIQTKMTAGLPEEILATARAETALDRLGDPIDVARAVLFLCSNLASHITGQVLRVDGGQCTA